MIRVIRLIRDTSGSVHINTYRDGVAYYRNTQMVEERPRSTGMYNTHEKALTSFSAEELI